jgi:hypothetical protein
VSILTPDLVLESQKDEEDLEHSWSHWTHMVPTTVSVIIIVTVIFRRPVPPEKVQRALKSSLFIVIIHKM